ncbi:GTPase RsgA [Rhodanobacter lindaniclasticus]
MPAQFPTLSQLGWRPGYSQQLTLRDFEAGYPARVIGTHRDSVSVLSSRGAATLPLPPGTPIVPVVGDWLLVEMDAPRVLRLIERHSVLAGLASAARPARAIAANLDSLFLVSACHDDPDPSRLQRHLAIAFAAGVEPVIVLTGTDRCVDVAMRVDAVQAVAPGVACLAVDVTSVTAAKSLHAWLDGGQTVAFVGSPGVGTSTLIDTLAGTAPQAGGVRGWDRLTHGMFQLPGGAWVMDIPGLHGTWEAAVDIGLPVVLDGVDAT